MKKYQLIGRRRLFTFKKQNTQYPLLHLCSLPIEILLQIFKEFDKDTRTLIILSLACKKFHVIINKNFLYSSVTFKKPSTFYKFSVRHLLHEPSSNINYLQKVELVNPQVRDSSKYKSRIAGAYHIESENRSADQLNYTDFIASIKSLLGEAFGLKCLVLSEVAPEFTFPMEQPAASTSSIGGLRLLSKKKTIPRAKRCLEKFVLRTQSGWSIPFKQGHLSLICEYFDVIKELHLVNFIIDDMKPINIEGVQIQKLVIESCIYTNSFKKSRKPQPNSIFNNVTTLELKSIMHDSGLSLIDLVRLNNTSLNHLIMDTSSSMFYTSTPSGNTEFNFTRFNPFFNLLCSGYGKLTTLTLTNFGLFDYFIHDVVHEDSDSWVEPPTNNFETFMKYVLQINRLVIVLRKTPSMVKTCIKCGFTEQQSDKNIDSLTPGEWKVFLKPLELNSDNSLKIFNYRNKLLYSSSKYNI